VPAASAKAEGSLPPQLKHKRAALPSRKAHDFAMPTEDVQQRGRFMSGRS